MNLHIEITIYVKLYVIVNRQLNLLKEHSVIRKVIHSHCLIHRLLDSLVVECWHRVREIPGLIPSQGPRHTKDVIKMVPVVPLFSTQH